MIKLHTAMILVLLYGIIAVTGGGYADWSGGNPPIAGQNSIPVGSYSFRYCQTVHESEAPDTSDVPQIVPWFLTT